MSNPFGSPPPRRGGTPHVDALSNYRAPRTLTGTTNLHTPRESTSSSSNTLNIALSSSGTRPQMNNDSFTSPTALANARLRDQLSQVSTFPDY